MVSSVKVSEMKRTKMSKEYSDQDSSRVTSRKARNQSRHSSYMSKIAVREF